MSSSLGSELAKSCIWSYEESYPYSSESVYVEDESVGHDPAMESSINSGDIERNSYVIGPSHT